MFRKRGFDPRTLALDWLTRHYVVTPGRLGLEQSSICLRDQRVRRANIIAPLGHANADRNSLLVSIQARLSNCQTHAFRKPDGTVKPSLRKDYQELLAAIATQVVVCPAKPGNYLRYAVQGLIPKLVPVCVINRFEAVKVEH